MAWESIKGLWNIETQCSKNSGRSGQIQGCFEEGANGTMIFTNVSAQKLDKKAKESKIRQIPHLFPLKTLTVDVSLRMV